MNGEILEYTQHMDNDGPFYKISERKLHRAIIKMTKMKDSDSPFQNSINQFNSNIYLKEVIIPKKCLSLKYIEDEEVGEEDANGKFVLTDTNYNKYTGAFENCVNLENVYIEPNSELHTIDENIFKGCIKLKSLDFRNCMNLETIGRECFNGCDNLSIIYCKWNTYSKCLNKTVIKGKKMFTSDNPIAIIRVNLKVGERIFPLDGVSIPILKDISNDFDLSKLVYKQYPELVSGKNSFTLHIFDKEGEQKQLIKRDSNYKEWKDTLRELQAGNLDISNIVLSARQETTISTKSGLGKSKKISRAKSLQNPSKSNTPSRVKSAPTPRKSKNKKSSSKYLSLPSNLNNSNRKSKRNKKSRKSKKSKYHNRHHSA